MSENLQAALAQLGVAITNYAPDVLGALIIVLLGWIVARVGASAVRKLCDRSERLGPTAGRMLARVTKVGLLAIVVIAFLDRLGVDTTSVIAALGAAGLAVGLALKDTIADVASGIVLLVLRPFDVGDGVEIGSTGGTVEALDLFETRLVTFDGVPIVIPNSKVRGSEIRNFTRAEKRRADIAVGIAYQDDPEAAIAAIHEMLAQDELTLADPAPLVDVEQLADSSVNVLVRVWFPAADFFPRKLELTRRLKACVERAGLTIPFPQRDVHIHGAAAG